jgi:hypothetical protein
MHHSPRSLTRLLYLVFAALILGAGEAQARRGIAIISTGSTFSELGPVNKAKLSPIEQAAIQDAHYDTVGYQYSHFGLFWLDIWNWGGEYIVYNKVSENGEMIKPDQAATLLGVEESKLSKPLNYRMPYGLLVIVGLVSLKMVPRLLAKRRQAEPVAQYQPDDRPQWTPQSPPPGVPGSPPAGGPPPMPPPLPPDQH